MPDPVLPYLSRQLGKPDADHLQRAIREVQRFLKELGFYEGAIDAHFGPLTEEAVQAFQREQEIAVDGIVGPETWSALYGVLDEKEGKLLYGDQVSTGFREEVVQMARRLDVDPDFLMAIMAWETDRTFRSDIRNYAGSSGTGLIQFMDSTAHRLGTTTSELAEMAPRDQLRYVEAYFEPFSGRLNTLEDAYMAVLWPRAVGKPSSYVLFRRPSLAYRQNSGLDHNEDGLITKWEATEPLREIYRRGLSHLA